VKLNFSKNLSLIVLDTLTLLLAAVVLNLAIKNSEIINKSSLGTNIAVNTINNKADIKESLANILFSKKINTSHYYNGIWEISLCNLDAKVADYRDLLLDIKKVFLNLGFSLKNIRISIGSLCKSGSNKPKMIEINVNKDNRN
jgi:hypothetical protein